MNRFLALLLFLYWVNELSAQKIDHTVSYRSIHNDAYFRFSYDNDFFTSSDYNYTQGYSFELVNDRLKKNPINHILISSKNSKNQYGLVLEHNGYTPKHLGVDSIIFNDRPYASAIMLKSFKIAIDTTHQSRLSTTFSLGVIGPAAFGKEMQVGIHNLTKNIIPQGWHNQIKNDLVINYQLNYERKLMGVKNNFILSGVGGINVGSLNNSVSAGATIILGVLKSPYQLKNSSKNFEIYIYAQPLVNYYVYDATLQGGFINDKSPHTLPNSRIDNLVYQFNGGIVIQTKKLFIEYNRVNTTKRFDTAISSKWGGIKFGIKF